MGALALNLGLLFSRTSRITKVCRKVSGVDLLPLTPFEYEKKNSMAKRFPACHMETFKLESELEPHKDWQICLQPSVAITWDSKQAALT